MQKAMISMLQRKVLEIEGEMRKKESFKMNQGV